VAAQFGRLQDRYHDAPPVPPELDRHREWALGLNRWFGANFVIKASYHWISGNRLAHPDGPELLQAVTTGQLKPRTRLVQLGTQFSF